MDEKMFPELVLIRELLQRIGFAVFDASRDENEFVCAFCTDPEGLTFRIIENQKRNGILVTVGFTSPNMETPNLTLGVVDAGVKAAKEIFDTWLLVTHVRTEGHPLSLRWRFFDDEREGEGTNPNLSEALRTCLVDWIGS